MLFSSLIAWFRAVGEARLKASAIVAVGNAHGNSLRIIFAL
jgi:hypothetical protein